MAAVAPYLLWLAELEEAKSSKKRQQQQQQQQQKRQQSVEETKECLLVIGSHINSLDASSGVSAQELWGFVTMLTEHSMSGEHLARFCTAMQLREDQQQGHQPAGVWVVLWS
jgi:hypothetical protein